MSKSRRLPVLCLAALFSFNSGVLFAESEVSKKIGSLVDQLDLIYQSRRPEKTPAVAILPLTVSEDLAKQNVGFAFSELLTHKFVRKGGFQVVERSQVHSVLAEQKFQQTGAVDTASASKIGKMLGAGLVVVGSVDKVGRTYQVNTRLVEVETTRVEATAYEEIPAEAFEAEAQPYLHLVAPTQTIGFYAFARFGGATDDARTIVSGSETVELKNFDANFYGAGFRYFPTARFFLDLAGMVPMKNEKVGTYTTTNGPPGFQLSNEYDLESSNAIRGFLGYSFFTGSHLNAHLGLGAIRYNLSASSGGSDNDFELKETVMFTRLGAEWRPQQRFGLSLAVMMDLSDAQGTVNGFGDAQTLNRYSFEPAANFYF